MILRCLMLFVVTIFSVSISATEIKLDMSAKRGLMIKLPHGDISSCSRMIAVEPPWVEKWFFNQSDDVTINSEQLENGEKFELIHGQDNGFKVIEYSAVRTGNSVKIIYQGKLTKDVPCALEYSAINVTDFFLAGASYSAVLMDGTPKEGVLPENETAKMTYLTNVKSISFESNYGTLNITVDKGIGLDVKNFRGSGFEGTLCYWIGVMDVPLKYGELFDSEITLEFIPNPNAVIPQPVLSVNANQPAKVVDNESLVVEAETFDVGMIPALKKQEFTQGTLTLGSEVDIDFNFKGDKVSVDRLRNAIDRVYGKLGGTASKATKIVATVGEESGELKAPSELDGYAMDITPTEITIVSRSDRGVFYAMQTLRSLVQDGCIAAQKIYDYPDLEYRGVHLLADKNSLEVHGKFVEEIFSRYKLNNIIYEIEYVAWDSTKNLHQPLAMSKEDLRKFVKLCEDNYIEINPLFQTLGHMQWLFVNGQNLDIAEDPATPYAYDISNPRTYQLMEEVIAEIIDVFNNPEYLHIGHDEVTAAGRYPYREENVKRGIVDLVMSDIMYYHESLGKRGIKIMIWQDMIMTQKESSNFMCTGLHMDDIKWFRDELPKDIVIANWNYTGTAPNSDFPCMDILTGEGFKTLGATWFETNNIEDMARSVKRAKGWGLLGTTWTGYFGNGRVLEDNFHQAATYLRLAAWGWNVSNEANKNRGDFLKEFAIISRDVMGAEEVTTPSAGKMLNLDSSANIEITKEASPFLRDGILSIDSVLKGGEVAYIGNMAFEIPEVNGNLGAIALKSTVNTMFPTSVEISMDDLSCNYLYFAHATLANSRSFGGTVATCDVLYDDGTESEITFKSAQNIGNIFSVVYSYRMPPECGIEWDDNGEARSLSYMTWANPYPTKKIKKLIFKSGVTQLPYYLFGISVQ